MLRPADRSCTFRRALRRNLAACGLGGLLAAVAGSIACTQLLTEDGLTGGVVDAGIERDAPSGDGPVESDAADTADDAPVVACDPCSDPSLARLPCPPATGDSESVPQIVFATRSMRMGLSWEEPDDWENLGFDRDCLSTQASGEPASCKAANAKNTEDGLQGRDNSFGRNLASMIPLAKSWLDFDIEAAMNDDMERGWDGWLIAVDGYNGTRNDPRVRVALYLSDGTPASADGGPTKPVWDGTDEWSYEPECVFGEDDAPLYVDDKAYVVDGWLVARYPGGAPFNVQTERGTISIFVVQVVLAARLSDDLTSIEEGMVSGVWRKSLAEVQIEEFAMRFGLCPPDDRLQALLALFELMPDIRDDLEPAPDLECDAISFGMGFTSHAAMLGRKADPKPSLPSLCTDAGADAGVDAGDADPGDADAGDGGSVDSGDASG